ncbi:unnamed protein product [marine sediment metagenome]|uniref:Uncharacterized protein n=1 Tax=marine sediment metagenome TaxID=412755 RepID=X1LLT5_9ZZZZ
MELADIVVLGIVGFVVLTFVAGIVDAEWEQRQRHKKSRQNTK